MNVPKTLFILWQIDIYQGHDNAKGDRLDMNKLISIMVVHFVILLNIVNVPYPQINEVSVREDDIVGNTQYNVIVKEEWVRTFSGPGIFYPQVMGWFAMTADPKGNVYVTGPSKGNDTYSDYVTIAYDMHGNELWKAWYDGPANGDDKPFAITMDHSGNIFVTGVSSNSANEYEIIDGYDIVTIAYDFKGKELWVARYNGPGNGYDFISDIAIDSNGNVIVAGHSPGDGTKNDFLTIAYNAEGKELWMDRYNGPGNADDFITDLAVDSFGNIIVTGHSYDNISDYDYTTIAYNQFGKRKWIAWYDGPENSSDFSQALAVDTEGNVYVTGMSHGKGSGRDFVTVAYNPSGKQLWVRRYNGPGNKWDGGNDIVVNHNGDIIVTGDSASYDDNRSYGSLGWDFTTIAYDKDGNELWLSRYNGPENSSDCPLEMITDRSGNIYITGWSRNWNGNRSLGVEASTISYDPAGNQRWAVRYNGSHENFNAGYHIAIDSFDNVYVVGVCHGEETMYDMILIKYSQKFLLQTISTPIY